MRGAGARRRGARRQGAGLNKLFKIEHEVVGGELWRSSHCTTSRGAHTHYSLRLETQPLVSAVGSACRDITILHFTACRTIVASHEFFQKRVGTVYFLVGKSPTLSPASPKAGTVYTNFLHTIRSYYHSGVLK